MSAQRTGGKTIKVHMAVIDRAAVLCGRFAKNVAYTVNPVQITCLKCRALAASAAPTPGETVEDIECEDREFLAALGATGETPSDQPYLSGSNNIGPLQHPAPWMPLKYAIGAGETREHELKTWPEFYRELESGGKTFELRKDDRGFRVGDVLWLREWRRVDGDRGVYTGREMRRRVTYTLTGFGLQDGFMALALAPAGETPPPASPVWQFSAEQLRKEADLMEREGRYPVWVAMLRSAAALRREVARLTAEKSQASSDPRRIAPPITGTGTDEA